MKRIFLLVVLVVLAIVMTPAPGLASAGHRWPVSPATVTQRFERPETAYGAGHRGLDLDVTRATVVHASAGGEVAFAGSVAGRTWVTIDHGGDLRTTVGPLATIEVARGDRAHAGQALGTALEDDPGHRGLHFSARLAGDYIDPASLIGSMVPTLVGPGSWHPSRVIAPEGYDGWDGRDTMLGLLPGTQRAQMPGWSSSPNASHVVAVSGLMTSTGSEPLPLAFLGYPEDDITRLSHAGLDGAGNPLPFEAADTFAGVHRSALLLRDQLTQQWRDHPGVAVDLVGHSFGGVVVMHYLLAIHDPADPLLPPIANVVTLASPLEGADGIAMADDFALRSPWGALLETMADIAGHILGVGPDPQTLDDLAVGSPLLRDLAASWSQAQQDIHRSPLATGTRVLTIGGSRDLVVPEHRSDLPGAEHVVVPGGHTAMHESEAVLQVVRAFLSEEPVPAGDGGWGAWLSPGISLAEQVVGVLG